MLSTQKHFNPGLYVNGGVVNLIGGRRFPGVGPHFKRVSQALSPYLQKMAVLNLHEVLSPVRSPS